MRCEEHDASSLAVRPKPTGIGPNQDPDGHITEGVANDVPRTG